jgi:hypothetical protein
LAALFAVDDVPAIAMFAMDRYESTNSVAFLVGIFAGDDMV